MQIGSFQVTLPPALSSCTLPPRTQIQSRASDTQNSTIMQSIRSLARAFSSVSLSISQSLGIIHDDATSQGDGSTSESEGEEDQHTERTTHMRPSLQIKAKNIALHKQNIIMRKRLEEANLRTEYVFNSPISFLFRRSESSTSTT